MRMKNTFFSKYLPALSALALFLLITGLPTCSEAEESTSLSTGSLLYIPAYSHVYYGRREASFLLTVTLSIRNIDMHRSIVVDRVEYYDNSGTLLNSYVTDPLTLGPLESYHFTVPENDAAGGFGANFIMRWHASEAANPPIVESVMIGTASGQGLSFTSRAVVIEP